MFACSNIQTWTKPNFVCVIIGAYHEGPSVNASDQISLILNAFNSYFFADAHPPTRTNINTPREAFRDHTAFPGFQRSPRDREDK